MAVATALAVGGMVLGAATGMVQHRRGLRELDRQKAALDLQLGEDGDIGDIAETSNRLQADAAANQLTARANVEREAEDARLGTHNQKAGVQAGTFDFLTDLSAEALIAGGSLDAQQGSSGFANTGSQSDQARVQDNQYGLTFTGITGSNTQTVTASGSTKATDADGSVTRTSTGSAAGRALDVEANQLTLLNASDRQITAGETAALARIDEGVAQYIAGVTEQESQATDALRADYNYITDTIERQNSFIGYAGSALFGAAGAAPAFADALASNANQADIVPDFAAPAFWNEGGDQWNTANIRNFVPVGY